MTEEDEKNIREGRVIDAGFAGFVSAAFPTASPEDVKRIRPIFFAGARLAIWALVESGSADEALRMMTKELEEYGQAFAAAIETKGNA